MRVRGVADRDSLAERRWDRGVEAVRLDDAVVLVTGASGAIGAACAKELRSRGSRVLVSGRNAERLGAVAADAAATPLPADLAVPGAADQLAEAAEDVYGRVDAVVHCAGAGWRGTTADMTAKQIDELLVVNVHAPLQLSRALLPGMLSRDHGHLAFTASIAGCTAVRHEAVYSATKAALIGYAESLRAELRETRVEVSAVSPAAVDSAFFATRGTAYGRRFPKQLTPERVARAIVHGIERNRPHQVVPRWLAVAPVVRACVPPVYRGLARRLG